MPCNTYGRSLEYAQIETVEIDRLSLSAEGDSILNTSEKADDLTIAVHNYIHADNYFGFQVKYIQNCFSG